MPKQADPVDRVLAALAAPSRRRMVEQLSRRPATLSELAEPLSMSLPAAMQHVQVLEASGLVRSEKVGRVRTCRLVPVAMQPVERWISERKTGWERSFDRLEAILDETTPRNP